MRTRNNENERWEWPFVSKAVRAGHSRQFSVSARLLHQAHQQQAALAQKVDRKERTTGTCGRSVDIVWT